MEMKKLGGTRFLRPAQEEHCHDDYAATSQSSTSMSAGLGRSGDCSAAIGSLAGAGSCSATVPSSVDEAACGSGCRRSA